MTRDYIDVSFAVHAMLNIAQIAVEVDELEQASLVERGDLQTA